MIVCVCYRVSHRDIARVAQSGCASFEKLQLELLVATACGKCRDCAHETFQQYATQALAAGQPPARSLGAVHAAQHPVFAIAAHPAREPAASAGA